MPTRLRLEADQHLDFQPPDDDGKDSSCLFMLKGSFCLSFSEWNLLPIIWVAELPLKSSRCTLADLYTWLTDFFVPSGLRKKDVPPAVY